MGGSIPIVGNLLGALTDSPKAAPVTPMIDTPAPTENTVSTVDAARLEADNQAVANKKQGRLSNIFTPSNTTSDLDTNAVNTFTKKLLGQ
jgi:hypothetical protein